MEKATSTDVVHGGLVANSRPTEQLVAKGQYHLECYDKDGKLKWQETTDNLVVNTGLENMAGVALANATQVTTWYIGLVTGPASGTSFAAADTMASHLGWTEFTDYSGSVRPAAVFAAATSANPSVVTNSANKASFSITNTGVVGGAFLTNTAAKSPGNTGTLFSAADFQAPGDRSVVSGDSVLVTYQFSLTAT